MTLNQAAQCSLTVSRLKMVNIYMCQVLLIKFLQLINELWTVQTFYHIWPWSVTLDLVTQSLLNASNIET